MNSRALRLAPTSFRQSPKPVSAEGLYETAMRLQREGKLEMALATYSQVILEDADLAEAYYGRATVCYALGNCDQAINDANSALELRHHFIEARLIRGAACWGKAAVCEADDPMVDVYCEQAISDCTFVLDYQPRAGFAYLNRGLAYWALRNKPKAKHDLENAVALSHNSPWRAEAERWLGELRKPRLLSSYEPDSWHHTCGRQMREL